MKTRIIIFCLFFANISFHSYSQITLGEIEKNIQVPVLKPEPFDSTANFVNEERRIDYLKYIGQQFYLPPIKKKEHANKILFTKSPNIISIDTNKYSNRRIIEKLETTSVIGNNKHIIHRDTLIYKNLFSFLYKPTYEIGKYRIELENSSKVGNVYYTILNVIYEPDKINEIKDTLKNTYYSYSAIMNKIKKKIEESNYESDYNENIDVWNSSSRIYLSSDEMWYDNIYSSQDILFELRNNSTMDTVYTKHIGYFILVPYFVKMKNLYESKMFVYEGKDYEYAGKLRVEKTTDAVTGKEVLLRNGNKWKCSDVNVYENSSFSRLPYAKYGKGGYSVGFTLKNSDGETILISGEKYVNYKNYITITYDFRKNTNNNDYLFIEESTYNERARLKKIKKSEIIAEQKRREKQRKIKEEKVRNSYITKYGEKYGNLIADGKVAIGMSKEMCNLSWGVPFWSDKTTTELGVLESWYYSFRLSLHFENKKLIIIDE